LLPWAAGAAILILLVWFFAAGGDPVSGGDSPVFVAKRGDIVISVLESGNLKALESKEIKSRVEGRATIIYLITEGTRITEEDIAAGKILVELDSSDLRERTKSQEITFRSVRSDYEQSKEALDIQRNQNRSDINAGELNVHFSLLDLKRYLGEELAEKLIGKEIDLFDKRIISMREDQPGLIEGASLQSRRDLENAIKLAEERVKRAEDDRDGTKELEAKGFVSKNDLDADELALKSRKVELEQARTARDLFLKYDFYKEAEKLLSDYSEAKLELERIKARANAQRAQKESVLEANKAKFDLHKDRLDDYREQIENCTIKATAPGLVVWANSSGDWGRQERRIEEGATVYERQGIITIPDISTMAVEVKVHETSVDRVEVGQKTVTTVDALPDLTLNGEVLKVAILPDSQSRWLNPDLKVYSTDVSIEGHHPLLKPGMSAQVKIIMKVLKDVLYVPVQAVVTRRDKHFCFFDNNGDPSPVPVTVGDYNDTFIEIKDGLVEGDSIMLDPPMNGWELSHE